MLFPFYKYFQTNVRRGVLKWNSSYRRGLSVICEESVGNRIRRAEAVCFDVDSTIITTEGIDELGAFLGKAEEVAELTLSAMNGDLSFQDALSMRLQLLEPSCTQIQQLLEQNPPKLTPGIQRLIDSLRSTGKSIFLVSGGFENMIVPVAQQLNIPLNHVFANRLLFNNDVDGTYYGFDRDAFTARAGGKAHAIRYIKEKYGFKDGVVMVGDGGTDYEARAEGAADVMIGYGGVIVRKIVQDNADMFIKEWGQFQDLLTE
jgi:phosphoserine phosphatase